MFYTMTARAGTAAVCFAAAALAAAALVACAALPETGPAPSEVPPGAPPPLAREPEALEAPAAQPRGLERSDLAVLVDACPALQAEREKIARESGLVLQGSYMPNPVLRLETEMMPIDDLGFGNARNKVIIAQRFETAGKADRRVAAAEARRRVAEAAYFVRRSEIQAEAAELFDRIVFARREIAGLERIRDIRGRLLQLAADLNATGRMAERRLIEFEVGADRSESDLLRAAEQEAELIARLEALLGLAPGMAAGCRGGEIEWEAPAWEAPAWEAPAWEAAAADVLSRNPRLVLLDRAVAAAAAETEVMEAVAWPDLTVGLGYSRGSEGGGERDDFVTGFIEMPMPLVDRNRGGVISSEAAVRAAERELEAAAGAALDEWRGLERRWRALAASRELHAGRILPRLERSREIVRAAVGAGRLEPQAELDAALDVEEEILRLLALDRDLDALRIAMIEVAGGERL